MANKVVNTSMKQLENMILTHAGATKTAVTLIDALSELIPVKKIKKQKVDPYLNADYKLNRLGHTLQVHIVCFDATMSLYNAVVISVDSDDCKLHVGDVLLISPRELQLTGKKVK